MPREEIIYRRAFPEDNIITPKAAKEFRANDPDKKISPSFDELLAEVRRKYEYRPRPGAEETARRFAGYAIAVCEKYRIDTIVTRNDGGIDVSMRLFCGPYFGPVKEALGALMRISDDVVFTFDEDDPGFACVTMSYYTYDRHPRAKCESA